MNMRSDGLHGAIGIYFVPEQKLKSISLARSFHTI